MLANMPFITSSLIDGVQTVTIDGSSQYAPKTHAEGDVFVQLRRAEASESGFNWNDSRIKAVVAKNLVIYDEKDANCLGWFIIQGIKIDLSASHVSTRAFYDIERQFKFAKYRDDDVQAVKGSKIAIPMLQGFSGMGQADAFKQKCQEMGFETC